MLLSLIPAGSGYSVRVVWFDINLIELTHSKFWFGIRLNISKFLIFVRFWFNFVKISDKFGYFG